MRSFIMRLTVAVSNGGGRIGKEPEEKMEDVVVLVAGGKEKAWGGCHR